MILYPLTQEFDNLIKVLTFGEQYLFYLGIQWTIDRDFVHFASDSPSYQLTGILSQSMFTIADWFFSDYSFQLYLKSGPIP